MSSFMRYISITSRCATQYRGERLSASGLNGCHIEYILTICRMPGISQDQLAQTIPCQQQQRYTSAGHAGGERICRAKTKPVRQADGRGLSNPEGDRRAAVCPWRASHMECLSHRGLHRRRDGLSQESDGASGPQGRGLYRRDEEGRLRQQ